MEEDERILGQMLERGIDGVAGTHQSRRCVAHRSLRLKTLPQQPLIGEREALAAVIILPVVDADGAAFAGHGAVLGHAIRHAGAAFGQRRLL